MLLSIAMDFARFPVPVVLFLCIGLCLLHTPSTAEDVDKITPPAAQEVDEQPDKTLQGDDVRAEADQPLAEAVNPTSPPAAGQEEVSHDAGAEADTDQAEVTVQPTAEPAGTLSSDVPDFVLRTDGKICLRAAFKASLTIRYFTNQVNTNLLTTLDEVPREAAVSGECGKNVSHLVVNWSNNTLHMEFTLEKSTKTSRSMIESIFTWSVTLVTYTFNTQAGDFHDPVKPGEHTVLTRANEKHFEAPMNFSYTCESQEDIVLREYNENNTVITHAVESVNLALWDVSIQGFAMQPEGKFGPAAVCKPDVEKEMPHQNVVPVAVAACLAAVILVIIIGYFFVKNRAQKQYTGLE